MQLVVVGAVEVGQHAHQYFFLSGHSWCAEGPLCMCGGGGGTKTRCLPVSTRCYAVVRGCSDRTAQVLRAEPEDLAMSRQRDCLTGFSGDRRFWEFNLVNEVNCYSTTLNSSCHSSSTLPNKLNWMMAIKSHSSLPTTHADAYLCGNCLLLCTALC